MDTIVQRYYSRPIYIYVGGDPRVDYLIDLVGKGSTFVFIYTGNRWVGYLSYTGDLSWDDTRQLFDVGHGKIHLFHLFHTLRLTLLI